MKLLKANNMRRYAVVLIAALVLALVLELLVFVGDSRVDTSATPVSLLDANVSTMATYGYEIDGNRFTRVAADSQLIFTNVGQETKYILISFARPILGEVSTKVYYAVENEQLSEDRSMEAEIPFGTRHFVLAVPQNTYETLRVDIDGSFYLENIAVSSEPINTVFVLANSFSILRLAAMFVVLAAVMALFVRWLFAEKNERRLSGYELLFCLGCLIYYTLWAVAKNHNYAPDEAMRYDVTKFLFNNNRLPVKDELLSNWGFCYAHLPNVLCNYLGYVLMKAVSIFTCSPRALLIAARMASVLCGVGAVYFVIKISKLVFQTPARWIMVVFVALMPQFAFLSSYVNNDTASFLGVAMIVYAWALGIRYGWDWKRALLLAVGIGICGLSYYFSYSWVLFSIFLFLITYFVQNKKDYMGAAKLVGLIAGVVFLMMGYTFIRHLVLYGDLLGFKTTEYYGELYAIDALKPSNRVSLQQQGIPLMTMLHERPYQWIEYTRESFIGVFGYMEFDCPDEIYEWVEKFVKIGAFGLVIKAVVQFLVKREKPDISKVTFWCCMILSGAVTLGISLIYSYTSDFQPQGRYCYPMMMSLAFLIAKGYEQLVSFIKNKEHQYAITAVVCSFFAAMSLYVYWAVYLPS